MKDILFLMFSMNRPLQVEGAISSLKHFCIDLYLADIKVLYKADDKYVKAYDTVMAEHPDVKFIQQNDFKQDIFEAINYYEYVVFLVDDNLFTEKFYVKTASEILYINKTVRVFSYRLGLNTTYCYPVNKKQAIPDKLSLLKDNTMIYNWKQAELDFAYPMDVSSSMYRVKDIAILLMLFICNNPNQLEGCLDMCKAFFPEKEYLACYKQSVAFCNPINKVNVGNNNRSGNSNQLNIDSLLEKFNEGKRLDISRYELAIISGCHQEMNLYLRSKNG